LLIAVLKRERFGRSLTESQNERLAAVMVMFDRREELEVSTGRALASANGFAEPEHFRKDAKALRPEGRPERTDVAIDELASTTARAFADDLRGVGFLAHAGIL
jgi:hypothetical protein